MKKTLTYIGEFLAVFMIFGAAYTAFLIAGVAQ